MTSPARAVLVTGASRGIGAAIARAFADAGDRVALNYARSAEQAAAVLRSLPGEGHVLAPADVADPVAVAHMVEHVAAELGGIDVVVNNAAVFLPHPVDSPYDTWQQVWQRTLAVNLVGAANVTHCAIGHLRASRRGRIVNIASRGAFRGEPEHPAYGASKAALVAFGQSMARALGPDRIAVTTVAPGWVVTDMSAEALAGDGLERRSAESPLGRVATPEEIAAAVLWLASAQAEFATGAVLDVNGGSNLRM